jgi:tight adherence protein B
MALVVINLGDPHYYDEVRETPMFIPACIAVGLFLSVNLFVMRTLTNIKV